MYCPRATGVAAAAVWPRTLTTAPCPVPEELTVNMAGPAALMLTVTAVLEPTPVVTGRRLQPALYRRRSGRCVISRPRAANGDDWRHAGTVQLCRSGSRFCGYLSGQCTGSPERYAGICVVFERQS